MPNEQDSQYKKKYILEGPKYTVIEKTAAEFAAVWYETGRSQGLTSKWKTPKAYARANFEKFIPKALEILLSMLNRSDIHDLMKEEIYEAIMERHNDKALTDIMPNIPNIDITKLLPKHDRIADVNTVLHNNTANPFKVKRGH